MLVCIDRAARQGCTCMCSDLALSMMSAWAKSRGHSELRAALRRIGYSIANDPVSTYGQTYLELS
jgi:hypothetical protein